MPDRRLFVYLVAILATSIARADVLKDESPTLVTLGDSITKGVRAGVLPEETFTALVERQLKAKGLKVQAINMGIGGERTDESVRRLKSVLDTHPRIVTIMYGTNDSYVDPGKSASRITVEEFRKNLKTIVADLRQQNIVPVLMTEPRWAPDATDGRGQNPNGPLIPFMDACREVAKDARVPLVDHFAHWTEAEAKGQALRDWMTDGCHPNPRGHREMADLMLPVLLASLQPPAQVSTNSALRKTLEAKKPVRVVCFGDSVTGVYYHTGGRRAYTDMLGIALRRILPDADLTTINAGISGNTTQDGLSRIDRDVLAHKPTLVTVAFGLNDAARLPIDEFRKNLAVIVTKCRASGADVLLCTTNNVITSQGPAAEKVRLCCQETREAGRRLDVPVCDFYTELEAQRARDPLAWRMTMSDEVHPNMDGHKRMAELLARTITGQSVSLDDVPPPTPVLPRVAARIAEHQPVRILAMSPFDAQIVADFKDAVPEAKVEITPWSVDKKSLAEVEADAKARVRPLAPDLVVLAVPREAKADSDESFIHSYAWVMNWSLNFGLGGWDCVVVHPSVVAPDPTKSAEDERIRRLVRAQDLTLIDRAPGDSRPAAEIFREWLQERPWQAH
ncbi:SGNH/GDSL hydrolase family protein [Singulisphaera rosea]